MPVFRMNTKIKSRFMPKPTRGGKTQHDAALPFDPTEAGATPMGAAHSPLSVPRSDSTELARAVTLVLSSAGAFMIAIYAYRPGVEKQRLAYLWLAILLRTIKVGGEAGEGEGSRLSR